MQPSRLISRVGVPLLADCDQSHLCNQWLRISRAAPLKKAEIFRLSLLGWISLFVSRDFPWHRERHSCLPTHGNWLFNVIFYICVHERVRLRACVPVNTSSDRRKQQHQRGRVICNSCGACHWSQTHFPDRVRSLKSPSNPSTFTDLLFNTTIKTLLLTMPFFKLVLKQTTARCSRQQSSCVWFQAEKEKSTWHFLYLTFILMSRVGDLTGCFEIWGI